MELLSFGSGIVFCVVAEIFLIGVLRVKELLKGGKI
jgi:hypothetical protein